MPYDTEISRKHPTAFLFLIDQSGSMGGEFGMTEEDGNPISKAQAVANAINDLLEELISRCQKGGGIFDYFDIALIAYGKTDNEAYFAWEGSLKDKEWCKISQLKTNYFREETRTETHVIRGINVTEDVTKKIWVEPIANGRTPMKAALNKAKILLQEWIQKHHESFPPIVINITDAAATDITNKQELIDAADEIKSLKTDDGNVIMFNCHISASKETPVFFPGDKADLPNKDNAHTLFAMSSELPERYINLIIELTNDKDALSFKKAWGMAYNSDIKGLIKLLDIGTHAANT